MTHTQDDNQKEPGTTKDEPQYRTVDVEGFPTGPWCPISELPPMWHAWDHCACLVPRKGSVPIEWKSGYE
jgi:hypothetical protein